MLASEFIAILQAAIIEHGDLQVAIENDEAIYYPRPLTVSLDNFGRNLTEGVCLLIEEDLS